jgi:hypothetical protein
MACGGARFTRRAASLPGEGSTHLRGCGMTAVGPEPHSAFTTGTSVVRGRPEMADVRPNRR